MANLVFVAQAKPASASDAIDLADIPEEIKSEVEQVYEALKTNPGRFHVEFQDVATLNKYVAQVQAYCAQRPAGAIRFRRSPVKGQKANVMDFRITDLKTPNEETTDGINAAVENVKVAAKK